MNFKHIFRQTEPTWIAITTARATLQQNAYGFLLYKYVSSFSGVCVLISLTLPFQCCYHSVCVFLNFTSHTRQMESYVNWNVQVYEAWRA